MYKRFYRKRFSPKAYEDWKAAEARAAYKRDIFMQGLMAGIEIILEEDGHDDSQFYSTPIGAWEIGKAVKERFGLELTKEEIEPALLQMNEDRCIYRDTYLGPRNARWVRAGKHNCEPIFGDLKNIRHIEDPAHQVDKVGQCKFCGRLWLHELEKPNYSGWKAATADELKRFRALAIR